MNTVIKADKTEKKGFVKRYETFEKAQIDQWVFDPDKNYFQKVLLMHSMSLLKRLGQKVPKGVHKYKSFEDAQKEAFQWILMD